jgi:hypothetical protein
MDLILLIECEILSLKLEIELLTDTFDLVECLVHIERIDGKRQDTFRDIEVNK